MTCAPEDPIVARVERRLGAPGLARALSEDVGGSALQSLLLAVFDARARTRVPARVLERWQADAFVRPSPVSPLELLELDRDAFASAAAFQPVELAPLTPLATCSSVAPVAPKHVVATCRNTEIVADATNVLALECATRRRALLRATPRSRELVRLCASHRVTRAQRFDAPGFTQHFRLFALCSAGRDVGGHQFEYAALREHVTVHLQLLAALAARGYRVERPRLHLYTRDPALAPALDEFVLTPLRAAHPELAAAPTGDREGARTYYPGFSFNLTAVDHAGVELPLADGGVTDWTARLLQNRKERLMISGIGSELICRRLAPRR